MSRFKRLLPLAGALALGMAPAALDAQTVWFEGFTSGCFGSDVGCVEGATSSSVNFLTFTGAEKFVAEEYYLDDYATGIGSTSNNFGVFNLSNTPEGYSDTFQLWVEFTLPTSNTETFAANITGTVKSTASGVNVEFTSPKEYHWYDGGFRYTVGVRDMSVTADGADAPLYGYVQAVTPEPVSIVLMGSGLLALAGFARRRTKNGDIENI